jgi:hypothetical protein
MHSIDGIVAFNLFLTVRPRSQRENVQVRFRLSNVLIRSIVLLSITCFWNHLLSCICWRKGAELRAVVQPGRHSIDESNVIIKCT